MSNSDLSVIAANAGKTFDRSRPAAESIEAARRLGAFALHRGDAVTAAARLVELGAACPATSWIAGTCATAKTFVATGFDRIPDFAADPDTLACGSGDPGRGERVGDQVRLTGRWPVVSGCEDAAWAGLGVIVDGAMSFAAVPMSELRVEHTWDVAGMRGTGSHAVVAEGVLVPAAQVAPMSRPPVARMLYFGLLVLAPLVGAARGGLDVVATRFTDGSKPYMTAYERMGDSPAARQWRARATLLTDRAERTLLAVAAAADGPAELSPADGARLHLDLSDAAADCRHAMGLMLDLAGSGAFSSASTLQRLWRDLEVGSRHAHLNAYLAEENYGKVLA